MLKNNIECQGLKLTTMVNELDDIKYFYTSFLKIIGENKE